MLAHVPSFGPNPRGSPDFLVYPVPKACMHVLGTGVPRRLGVARSASSPKAALALGCSLTAPAPDLVLPGHLHDTGCLSARAMNTGFPIVVWHLCLGPGCALVWVSVTQPALAGVFGGCVWVRFMVSLSLFPPGYRSRAPTPQRMLLGAGVARCGGGRSAPGGGVLCLSGGCPGLGPLPPRTACHSRVRPVPATR